MATDPSENENSVDDDSSLNNAQEQPSWPDCVKSRQREKWGKRVELDIHGVNIRSKHYMQTRQKIPSESPLFTLAYVDIFTMENYKDSDHIILQPESWYYKNWDKLSPSTFYLVFNLQLSSIRQCIACYYILNTKELPPWMIQEMRNDLNNNNNNNNNNKNIDSNFIKQFCQWSQLSTSSINSKKRGNTTNGSNGDSNTAIHNSIPNGVPNGIPNGVPHDGGGASASASTNESKENKENKETSDDLNDSNFDVWTSGIPAAKSTVVTMRINKKKKTYRVTSRPKIFDINVGNEVNEDNDETDENDENDDNDNNDNENNNVNTDTSNNNNNTDNTTNTSDNDNNNSENGKEDKVSKEDTTTSTAETNTQAQATAQEQDEKQTQAQSSYIEYLTGLWKRHSSVSRFNDVSKADTSFATLKTSDYKCLPQELPIMLENSESKDSFGCLLPKQFIRDTNLLIDENDEFTTNAVDNENEISTHSASNLSVNSYNNNNHSSSNIYNNNNNSNANKSNSRLSRLRRKISSSQSNDINVGDTNNTNGNNSNVEESKSASHNMDNNPIQDMYSSNENDETDNDIVDTLLWCPKIGYGPLDDTDVWLNFLTGKCEFINERTKFIPRVMYVGSNQPDSDDEEGGNENNDDKSQDSGVCKDNGNGTASGTSGNSSVDSVSPEPLPEQNPQPQPQSRGWGWSSKLSSFSSSSLSKLSSVKKFVGDTVSSVGSSAAVTAATQWLKNTMIKPAILGRHCDQKCYRGHNYLEIDCRADGTMVGRRAVTNSWSLMRLINVHMCFVIEGRNSHELPERCLGGCKLTHLKVVGNSVKLRTREWVEQEMSNYYRMMQTKIENQRKKFKEQQLQLQQQQQQQHNGSDDGATDEPESLETFGKNDIFQKELTNVDGIQYEKVQLKNGNVVQKATSLMISDTTNINISNEIENDNNNNNNNNDNNNNDDNENNENNKNTDKSSQARVSLKIGDKRESLSLS